MSDTFLRNPTPTGQSPAPASEPDWPSDVEVVTRVCSGETALFELLMRRHNQRIFRALRAVLRDDSEVEDAMQECYLRAYRQLSTFEQRSTVATWLTRIGVNLALDRRRRAGRIVPLEPHALEKALGAAEVAPGATPEDEYASRELADLLTEAIDELPDGYRAVFVMREIEGLGTRDTAESLGMEEATVKTRLHRARVRLRASLGDRAGASFQDVYEFGGERCNRVVARVLGQLLEPS